MPDIERDLTFYPVSNPHPAKLTREQIVQYNEKGFISPLDVFDADEIAEHRRYFDRLLEAALARGWNSYSINGWHTRCRGVYDLVVEPRILDYVQDIVGEDVICWGTHYFAKMPGDGKRVSWHQDASYWPLTPSKTVTVWLAIDDADEENGAMQVIPGSHRFGQIPFEQSDTAENNVLNQTVPAPDAYGEKPVAFVMRAGQMSLHSDLLLHGSEPNLSNRRRCGLTMRFAPPDVRSLIGWNHNSVICRGNDPSGHWANVPRPESDVLPSR
jgi:ectoine hydroxylase-related dioxygenase (phytanoyl-CoA dioxygenase family)